MNTHTSYSLIIDEANKELLELKINKYDLKAKSFTVFNKKIISLNNKQKVDFILEAVENIDLYWKDRHSYAPNDADYQIEKIWYVFMCHLLKNDLILDDDVIKKLMNSFSNHKKGFHKYIFNWPTFSVIERIEKQKTPPSPKLINQLYSFKEIIKEQSYNSIHDKICQKANDKIDTIIFSANNDSERIKQTWFPGTDSFAGFANNSIKEIDDAQQQLWFKLVSISKKGIGSNPSPKFITESELLINEMGEEVFVQQIVSCFQFITYLKDKSTEHVSYSNGTDFLYSTTELLDSLNIDTVKGFI